MNMKIPGLAAGMILLTCVQALAELMFVVEDRTAMEMQPIVQPRFGMALPDAPARPAEQPQMNAMPVIINQDAVRSQLQRLGWRDYGVPMAAEPPSLMFPDGGMVVLTNERLIQTGDNTAVIVGTATDSNSQSLIFIANDRIVGGEIFRNGRYYALLPDNADSTDEGGIVFVDLGEWMYVDEAETHPVSVRARAPFLGGRTLNEDDIPGAVEATDGTDEPDEPVDRGGVPAPPLYADVDDLGPAGRVSEADEPDTAGEAKADDGVDEPGAFTATGKTIVDLLVVYPESLEAQMPSPDVGVKAYILAAVDDTNRIYERSGVDLVLNLVGMEAVDYQESGEIDTDLRRLVADGDGHLDRVLDLWRDSKADIVSLWVGPSDDDYPGVAYTMESVDVRFAPCAANVVRWPATKRNLSFAHELAHNMGARHDTKQTPENLPYQHAHGYVRNRIVSIMAYPMGSCPAARCERQPEFSNPSSQFGDVATADNRLTLNKTASVVSRFDTQHQLLGSCNSTN